MVTRYNLYPAAPINGSDLPTLSSGEAIDDDRPLAASTLAAGR